MTGPVRATRRDIGGLNEVFAEAFTERYRRDGLSGVRVPLLNPAIWEYALADAGDGALLWRDGRSDIIAFNIVHRSGTEGWMGPLAVRTDRQARGLGAAIVRAGIAWLEAQGAQTIGLETMPRTIDNIGFYSRLGFVPGNLTVTVHRERLRADTSPPIRLGTLSAPAQAGVIEECRALACAVAEGVDFTREIELTREHRLGDVTLVRDDQDGLEAFALWHSAPLAQTRHAEELRVLKLAARDVASAMRVLRAAEREATALRLGRIAVRCQTAEANLYTALLADGYRVQWTDLRMTLAGKPELPRRGVMLSNWEI